MNSTVWRWSICRTILSALDCVLSGQKMEVNDNLSSVGERTERRWIRSRVRSGKVKHQPIRKSSRRRGAANKVKIALPRGACDFMDLDILSEKRSLLRFFIEPKHVVTQSAGSSPIPLHTRSTSRMYGAR